DSYELNALPSGGSRRRVLTSSAALSKLCLSCLFSRFFMSSAHSSGVSSTHRLHVSTPSASRPRQVAQGASPVRAEDNPAPTNGVSCSSALSAARSRLSPSSMPSPPCRMPELVKRDL